MSLRKYSTHSLVLLLFLCYVAGCNVTDNDTPTPEPERKAILVALIGNNPSGFWFFDADSLERVDSLHVDHTPNDFVIDSVTQNIFWANQINNTTNELLNYNYADKVTSTILTDNYRLSLIGNNSLLLSYGSAKTQVFNAEDLTLIKEDSIGVLVKAFPSKNENIFYSIYYHEEDDSGELMFATISVNDFEIIHSFSLGQLYFSDAVLSKDEQFLYVGYTEYVVSDEYGRFGIFDIENGVQTKVLECGPNSSFGASPDGKNIYIGWREGYASTGVNSTDIYQFNTVDQSMNVFLSYPSELGLVGNVFVVDELIVSPDNQRLFFKPGVKEFDTGEKVHLVQLDIPSKTILSRFEIPRDKEERTLRTGFWGFDFLFRETDE